MRIILADIKGRTGFVNKDTVAGGYGSRFHGRSRTTRIVEMFRKLYQHLPSLQLGYLAAIFAQAGHEVAITHNQTMDGDLALILTSIVDFRHEIEWAKEAKQKFGMPVGFFGTFATHVPDALEEFGDFVIQGEPETAAMNLASGAILRGKISSAPVQNLDSLPFPRWDLFSRHAHAHTVGRSLLRSRAAFPLLSSRSCPEFCTYCPHRITAAYRERSPENVLNEIEQLCARYGKIYVVFRDPLFTENRERNTAICEGIIREKLPVQFECETRMDDLDRNLIDILFEAGLRTITFGVESVDPLTLKRVGRRPIPTEHQKAMISYCKEKGITTEGFYVFGFLTDTAQSIRATVDYALDLGTTMALFRILTPYPGTPLRKQLESLITETDMEKFDGYTPTFRHPNLANDDLSFLLNAAYTRFYIRPSWLGGYVNLRGFLSKWLRQADAYAEKYQSQLESDYFLSPDLD
jgi:anaerobic magnesium-protoporphyrin IX monomethyl ester cyclase